MLTCRAILPGRGRRGVASVVGTLVFVLVFILAMGAQAYIGGLQAQSAQSQQEALAAASLHGGEQLAFSNPSNGLVIFNGGEESSTIAGIFFRYPNGSVYSGSGSAQAYLPSGASLSVQGIVPSSTCKDQGGRGSATCVSRFDTISGTTAAGYSVGVVTSRGNTFWYTPSAGMVRWSTLTSFPTGCAANQYATAVGQTVTCSQVGWSQLSGYPSPCGSNQYVTAYGATLSCAAISIPWSQLNGFPSACPAGQFVSQLGVTPTCSAAGGGALASYLSSGVWTSGKGTYSSTGLSVQLQPNHVYGFYAFTAIEPEFGTENYNFEVHPLPSGASLVIACAPMSYPQGGGNQPTNCVTSPGTPIAAYGSLGFGVSPPVFQTPGVFGLVSVGGTGGTLEIDFACIANCGGVTMNAGSFMIAIQVG